MNFRTVAIFGFGVMALFSVILFLMNSLFDNRGPSVLIGNQRVWIEVAKSDQETRAGLSGRSSLGKDWGMLFLFPQEGRFPFWMKGMKFNLDFVFMRGEEVVDLAENIPFPKEGEQPQRVVAQKGFDKVLEINAGMIQKWKIKLGDKISLPEGI